MTPVATNQTMIEAARCQDRGDHAGAARVMLANLGLAGRDRPLWLLLAACQWWMARELFHAKKTLGRVDPKGLGDEDRRQYERVLQTVNDALRKRRRELHLARSTKHVKVPTFLGGVVGARQS